MRPTRRLHYRHGPCIEFIPSHDLAADLSFRDFISSSVRSSARLYFISSTWASSSTFHGWCEGHQRRCDSNIHGRSRCVTATAKARAPTTIQSL